MNVEGLQTVLKKLGSEAQKMATTAGERLRAEGREEGYGRGLEDGAAKGREEGREEGRRAEKLAMARRLLAEGMSVPKVAKLAELPEDEVRKLSA